MQLVNLNETICALADHYSRLATLDEVNQIVHEHYHRVFDDLSDDEILTIADEVEVEVVVEEDTDAEPQTTIAPPESAPFDPSRN